MARNSIPGFKLGGGKGKTITVFAVIVLLVLIVRAPIEVAEFVKSLIGGGDTALTSVVTFFQSF